MLSRPISGGPPTFPHPIIFGGLPSLFRFIASLAKTTSYYAAYLEIRSRRLQHLGISAEHVGEAHLRIRAKSLGLTHFLQLLHRLELR